MSNTVQHKRSNTHGATPTTSDLAVGEIGINTHDKKIFTNTGSAIAELGVNFTTFGGDGSSGGVTLANGYVDIRGNSVSEATYVNFYCESSNAHAVKLQAPAHADFSGNITATLPNVTGTLVTSDAQKRIEVVSALPSSPDANTIYFVT